MKWRHKHVTMQLVINKSKLHFASRARFMLKQRERECIFLVYRMVWLKISVTKWTKTSQVTKSLWGNPVLREFSMKKSMSQIVLLRIIMSLWRPHTGHESWLMRWAFPIITPPFIRYKCTFSCFRSYNLLSEGAWKKEAQVIFTTNAQLDLIQYSSCENRS